MIRFGLALLVFAGHAQLRIQNAGPLMAVQLFFVVSGVYMAAVFTTKYGSMEKGVRLFFLNRVLRLWPTYLLLLAFTWLAFVFAGAKIRNDFHVFTLFLTPLTAGDLLYLVPAELLLVGQDVISLDDSLQYLMPVRQSWSIGTELLFYALVPMVAGRRFCLWVAPTLIVACFAFKFAALQTWGWRASYFLPPGNLAYFLLGCCLYHLAHARTMSPWRRRVTPAMQVLGPAAFAGLALASPNCHFESGELLLHFAFLASFSAILVLTFPEKASRFDNYLGNLSYAFYLNHFLVVMLLANFLPWPRSMLAVAVLVVSVACSIATERFLQRPIDRFRRRVTSRAALGAAASG